MVQRRLELFLAAVTLTVFEVRALIQPNATDICLPFQSNQNCSDLPATCIVCNFNTSCVYGANTSVQCSPKSDVVCKGDRNFTRTSLCMYCYQLPPEKYCCTQNNSCVVRGTPPSKYLANCTVFDDTLCLSAGRTFSKWLPCNRSIGKRWSTAVLLSFTVGGFGIDRFYLEQWGTAVGKLVTFGGLGVWSILDVILIATGYLTPGDGSSYVY